MLRASVFRAALVAAPVLMLSLLVQRPAEAAMYSFMSGNESTFPSPPYATVDVTNDTGAGTVTFNLTSTIAGARFFGFAFNFDEETADGDPALVYGDTGINGFKILSLTTTDPLIDMMTTWLPPDFDKSMNGFEKFDLIVGGEGNNVRVTNLTLVLELVDPTKAVLSNFVLLNDDSPPKLFAAHFAPPGTNAKTGFIAAGPGDVVITGAPEPASAVLFGLGALGLFGAARRRREQGAVHAA